MTPESFINRWRDSPLTERAASQSHFNDLCKLLGEKSPTEADPKGEFFAFEKGAIKTTGGQGWADVWKRGCFAWEYKQPGRDLDAAFAQLQQYAVALENPPLLVVSDREKFRVHTNWTNTVAEVHEIAVAELVDAGRRQLLKWVLSDPERLRPKKTRDELTADVAGRFAELAKRLRGRKHDPHKVAHFINRLVFCMFAEDVDLLPKKLFSKMLGAAADEPDAFEAIAASLFKAMRKGGRVDFTSVEWFNGGLFDDDEGLPLQLEDIKLIQEAADLNWSGVDPAILGTLFERGLDPDKRSQLGAHYTDRDKIMMIVEPVINRPLTMEWQKIKSDIERAIAGAGKKGPALTRSRNKARAAIDGFLDRLKKFRVLDPACGSGNFLYLALHTLKDLEHRVNLDAEVLGFPRRFPEVGPQCVKGIELNPYAAELARVSVWVGEIQWMRRNGFGAARDPILKTLDAIECRDAILNEDGTEPAWPKADVIIGNPPFLGGKLMRDSLGDVYVDRLFRLYDKRVPAEADLVCYWFEKARVALDAGVKTSGLVATNSIRGGANREALKKAVASHPIFAAWSDEPWVVEGASVRVSIVCFGAGPGLTLDGEDVAQIHTDLTSGSVDLTRARRLLENTGIAFMGDTKGGAFDVPGALARQWLELPRNPNGRTNSDVLKPWINGMDVTRRDADNWIIDFGWNMTDGEAALYEAPFKYVKEKVWPDRQNNQREEYRVYWWRHVRPRPAMWARLGLVKRYIATPTVAKFRLFVWRAASICPDHQLIIVARDDDTTFGILHSRFHELWALRMGTSLEDRPRYTPSTTFETFPFPQGMTPNLPESEFATNVRARAIATAARRLNDLRQSWLDPSDLTVRVPEVAPCFPDRLLPKDEKAAAILKKRTLTSLYNERPQWLVDAHKALDAAVAAAYGWPVDLPDDDLLVKLFALNQERVEEGR